MFLQILQKNIEKNDVSPHHTTRCVRFFLQELDTLFLTWIRSKGWPKETNPSKNSGGWQSWCGNTPALADGRVLFSKTDMFSVVFFWGGSSFIWHLVVFVGEFSYLALGCFFLGVQLVAALRLLLVEIFKEKVSWQLFPLSSCENLMALELPFSI